MQNARTPLQLSQGTLTPNGLHFVVAQSGAPDIDPAKHRLVIHGMVKQPLMFTLDTLARYPTVSRMAFIECGGNSAPMFSKEPNQATVQALHGLVSCAEWTGVRLSTLLEETGIDAKAKWVIAEGADTAALNRSVPLAKCLDDAMIALYQNGERLMPANGYPARLLLPGWEGNMNIKYVRRIKITDQPGMTYYEARNYSPLLPDGRAYKFYFVNEVKSFITHPSFGTVVDASTVRAVVDFGRTLDVGARVLVHCRGGIGRSPACAIALHLAHGTTMAEAIQLVVADRPQAQPNPLFVLVLDEVLGATGELWHDYHQWAYRQPWWISGLEPDPSRSASATRSALRAQTHRTRQQ